MNNILIFIFKNTKIIIQKKHMSDILDCSYETPITLTYYNHKILLHTGHLASNVEILKNNLEKALTNQLQLPHDIKKLGYNWNYTLNQTKKSVNPFGENFNILNNYLLYSVQNTCTWLYNDLQGNIIFEITPLYPYTYAYGKKKPTYGHFLRWMQTYKITFKMIISQQIAQQWIDQATKILTEIDKNTQKLYLK